MTRDAAFKFVRGLATELSDGIVDLPGFPRVFTQVCRALDDPKNTNDQTANIVGAEPALAAKLITLTNSVALAPLGKPVSDLKSAVTRLGSLHIRSAASAFSVAQLKQQASLKSIADSLQRLWEQSTYVAAVCHVIGRNSKVNAEEALLTGLLHGIGSLYVLVRSAAHPGLIASDDELTALRLEWNAPIAKSILENWSFPDDIVQAVGDQDEPERSHRGRADLTDVLICAKTLIQCDLDRACVKAKAHMFPAFSKVGLNVDQHLNVIQHAKLQIASMQDAFQT